MEAKKPVLQVNNLVKQFGGLTAVNNVSLSVNEGQVVGLIGANGAGKTTLFNMIAGAFKPTSGTIEFHCREIQGLPSNKICKLGIARTYQIVRPFQQLSVLDNVTVGALNKHSKVKEAREYAAAVCDLIELGGRKDVIGANLTLPELKRMEVARALATEPELLLLDEALAGLNPSESMRMVDVIKRIGTEKGMTIVVIEHVMRAVMTLSDYIYVLNQGSLISKGTPDEVSKDPLVIRSYLGDKYANS